MKEYYIDGEKYYYNKGKWLNSSYVACSLSDVSKLNKLMYDNEDYESKSVKEMMKIIDRAREDDNYQLAAKVLECVIRKATISEARSFLPRLTSNYRRLGRPQTAIDVGESYIEKYKKAIWSHPLFTSIAAAYCDIRDFESAKKSADKARSLSGAVIGDELKLVYARIKSGMNCYR